MARGFTVELREAKEWWTHAKIFDEPVGMFLYEDRTTAKSCDLEPGNVQPELAGGKLHLCILEHPDGKSWVDNSKRTIEDCLNEFIIETIKRAAEKLAATLERRRQDDARNQAVHQRQRRAEDEDREKQIRAWSDSWHESMKIRAFAAAWKQEMLRRKGTIEVGSELDEWLNFAEQYADKIDPLYDKTSSPDEGKGARTG
jgi:hypothetical protein